MTHHSEAELVADDLFSRFESWALSRGVEADLFLVEVALDWRLQQGADPAKWDAADFRDLLLYWFPRKVTLGRAEWPLVVPAMHHWIDFLTTTPVGRTRDAGALHDEIDRNADAFQAAMADERNFGIAKFWVARMAEHGIDQQDAEQVREFLDAVNAGEIDYDHDVLDEIMRRDRADADDSEPLPPVVVPAEAELAELAEKTVLVGRLRTLTEWVGAGRALTQTKRLRVADARELAELLGVDSTAAGSARSSADLPEVSLLVAWATAIRLVRVVKGRLVAVKTTAGLLNRPWDLWRRAHEAFPALGPAACMPTSHYEGPSLLGQVLPDLAPDLWLALYRAGGTPLPVELLVQFVQDTLGGYSDLTWRRDLDGILAALEMLGAIQIESAETRDLEKIVQVADRGNPDPRLVSLTPLGVWGARQALLTEGIEAPLAEDLVDQSAERMCEALVYAHPDVTEVVLDEWTRARTPEHAAAELAGFCATTPSPTLRQIAWAALERTGAAGERQAERLRAAGGVVGAMAAEWLVRRAALDPREVREQEMFLAAAEGLAALHERGLLVEELSQHAPEDQLGFVRALAAGEHPDRTAMLAEVSAHHPSPEIADEARRAL